LSKKPQQPPLPGEGAVIQPSPETALIPEEASIPAMEGPQTPAGPSMPPASQQLPPQETQLPAEVLKGLQDIAGEV